MSTSLGSGESRVRADIYCSVVESQTELIIRWLPDGTRTFVNTAFCKYMGKPAEELLGVSFFDIIPKEDLEYIRHMIKSITSDGTVVNTVNRVRMPDGKIVWQQWADKGLFDEEGRLVEIQSVGRDVTKLKELEQQLSHAQKLDAIGTLAGGLAHDLNNLLTGILGYTTILKESLDQKDKLCEYVDHIMRAGKTAAEITDRLLTFSRKQVPQTKVLSLNDSVNEALGLIRRLISESIEIKTVLAPDLWPVEADASQIQNIIINLAVNSRDAMPDGGTLTIETKNVQADEIQNPDHAGFIPGQCVLLVLSDSGVGMDELTRSRAFEPFFTTKGQGKGNGLGLATVYGVVTQSNGQVWIQSEPGNGSTVTVCLPRVKREVEAVAPIRGKPADQEGTETILIAEDQDVVRSLAAEVLTRKGYRVFQARDGNEALQLLSQHTEDVDLLLTDVVMPGITGPALAEWSRDIAPHVRVVYMSGYSEEENALREIQSRKEHFIKKPFDNDSLALVVREALDSPPEAIMHR